MAEYWVIDLNNNVVYLHRAPDRGAYALRRSLGPGERLSVAFAPEVEFGVAELIG